MPKAELHQGKPNPKIDDLVMAGEKKYTNLRVPILAIFAIPHDQGPYVNANNSPAALAAAEANHMAIGGALATSFEAGVPSAHVVRLAHASHDVFMSNKAEVLLEMRQFLTELK